MQLSRATPKLKLPILCLSVANSLLLLPQFPLASSGFLLGFPRLVPPMHTSAHLPYFNLHVPLQVYIHVSLFIERHFAKKSKSQEV